MKPLLYLMAMLMLSGCASVPMAPPAAGHTVIVVSKDRLIGFVVDPGSWHCAMSDACDSCVNVSPQAAEIDIGYQQIDGTWQVYRRLYQPGAQVELCLPPISRYAWQR
jgi:hypothetical protein